MQRSPIVLALALAATSLHAGAADPAPSATSTELSREAIETGIAQIARECVKQWSVDHAPTKAAAFCDCVNADDVAAIRRIRTVSDMENWIAAAYQEAKLHEAGDPAVTALFQQRFERCSPSLR